MPNLDKTGPRGAGAKTGRGIGQCDPATSSTNAIGGRRRGCRGGRGFGLGLGRGLGQQSVPSKSPASKKKKLG